MELKLFTSALVAFFALIRITGLIVATIGLQLVFDGISNFIATLN